MDVEQIVRTGIALSNGNGNAGDDDLVITLKYLNLVHCELYGITASVNSYAPMFDETLDVDSDGRIDTPEELPFLTSCVRFGSDKVTLKELVPLTHRWVLSNELNQSNNTPYGWYRVSGKDWRVFPAMKGKVRIIGIVNCEPFNLHTPEEDIPYPVAYHQVLADGLFFYILQDDSGSRNHLEMHAGAAKWQQGKDRLMRYLHNTSNTDVISTYSG